MGLTFEPFQPNACCLCGSTVGLTGEHKIKASALRGEFGGSPMVIGRVGDPEVRLRPAQGVKSKALHFGARMCTACNTTRTQAADRAFDAFHRDARKLLAAGSDPKLAFDQERYAVGSEAYLNIFRYFSKLMCCHMAESKAPRRIHMARFAMGLTNQNCIWLDANEDWKYKNYLSQAQDLQYAAHGGLTVYGHKRTGAANGFHSTLTIGPLRYVYFTRLNWIERLELRHAHPDFHSWCRARVQDSVNEPMSEDDRLALGFNVETSSQC